MTIMQQEEWERRKAAVIEELRALGFEGFALLIEGSAKPTSPPEGCAPAPPFEDKITIPEKGTVLCTTCGEHFKVVAGQRIECPYCKDGRDST